MRRCKTVLTAWALAFAFLCCALGITQHANAITGLQVKIHPVKKRLRVGDRVRVGATIGWQGPRATFHYQWSALRGELPPNAVTNEKTLQLDAKDLTPGQHYVLELYVTADYQLPPEKTAFTTADEDSEPVEDRVAAQASVTFTVNAPPRDGSCQATLERQANGRAVVKVSAADWHDSDGDALQYRYFIINDGKRRLAHNWSAADSRTITTRAPANGPLQVTCEVRDTLGDSAGATSDVVEEKPAEG